MRKRLFPAEEEERKIALKRARKRIRKNLKVLSPNASILEQRATNKKFLAESDKLKQNGEVIRAKHTKRHPCIVCGKPAKKNRHICRKCEKEKNRNPDKRSFTKAEIYCPDTSHRRRLLRKICT